MLLGFANAAQRGAEADADPVLRTFPRIFHACVIECEFCRGNGELRVAIEPLQTVRWKKFFRIPIANLAGAAYIEGASVETRNLSDASFLGENSVPKSINAFADAGDRTNSGNDDTPSTHAVTGLA